MGFLSYNSKKQNVIKELQDIFDDKFKTEDEKDKALIDCNKKGKEELKDVKFDEHREEFTKFKSDITSCLSNVSNNNMSFVFENDVIGENHRYNGFVNWPTDVTDVKVDDKDLDEKFEYLKSQLSFEDEEYGGFFGYADDY